MNTSTTNIAPELGMIDADSGMRIGGGAGGFNRSHIAHNGLACSVIIEMSQAVQHVSMVGFMDCGSAV